MRSGVDGVRGVRGAEGSLPSSHSHRRASLIHACPLTTPPSLSAKDVRPLTRDGAAWHRHHGACRPLLPLPTELDAGSLHISPSRPFSKAFELFNVCICMVLPEYSTPLFVGHHLVTFTLAVMSFYPWMNHCEITPTPCMVSSHRMGEQGDLTRRSHGGSYT